MIYTLYSTIFSSAHNRTDWPPGTWNGITVLLVFAFTCGKDAHLDTQGNKGVTRLSLTVCNQAVLMSLRRICTTAGTLHCLIGGQWATRSLPVTAGKLLYFFSTDDICIFPYLHITSTPGFILECVFMFFLYYTKKKKKWNFIFETFSLHSFKNVSILYSLFWCRSFFSWLILLFIVVVFNVK